MKAIICGAGIAGLAAALSLHRHGWSVVLVERAQELRNGGYMIDFFGPGFDAAERLGILPRLHDKAHPVGAIDWVDASGATRAKLNYKLMQAAAGGKLFPLLRGDVEQVLYEAVRDKVDIRFGTTITGFSSTANGVSVALADGTSLDGDLLVGADGIHSSIRHQAFGSEAQFLRPLGFETAAYFFRDAEATRTLAGAFAMLTVPGRLAGFYEVDRGRLASFFVARSDGAGRPADPRQRLREVYGDLGWIVPEALAAAPEPDEIYFDTVAQVEMPCWHKDRVVLIGDAAYAVSLVAGQGASMALAGGTVLGEALGSTADIATALQSLEESLRNTVLQKQRGGRRTAGWFVPQTRTRIALRNLAFNALNTPLIARLMSPLFSLDSKGFAVGPAGGR